VATLHHVHHPLSHLLCDASHQALMAAYEGLIVKTAKYFASVSRLSWEELLVEARAGFLDAVASFDASRGARLSSIAPIRINFALNSAKLAQVGAGGWNMG
jgi:DNA-directed RNA polymerase specialized sigma subunit